MIDDARFRDADGTILAIDHRVVVAVALDTALNGRGGIIVGTGNDTDDDIVSVRLDGETIVRSFHPARLVRGEPAVRVAPSRKPHGVTVEVICANKDCGKPFQARVADRARGWAKFCSKSCKAIVQVQKTGWAGPGSGARPGRSGRYSRHDGVSEMKHKTCDTCGAPAINGVYGMNGKIEWGCRLHHDTTHPFSSDALGQW